MPWSGGIFNRTDGTRTGTQVWTGAANAGVDIEEVDHDTHDQDIADGLEECLKRTGGNKMTSDLELDGNNLKAGGGQISDINRVNLFRVGSGVVSKATVSEGDATFQSLSDEAAPADGVSIGSRQWLGRNSAGAEVVFGEVQVRRVTALAGSEAGSVDLLAQQAGVKVTVLSASSTGIRDKAGNLVEGLASSDAAPVDISGLSELIFSAIRSDASRITITCSDLNPSGGASGNTLEVQIGTSGGFVTTGYGSASSQMGASYSAPLIAANANQWTVAQGLEPLSDISGTIVLEKHGTGNIWMLRASMLDPVVTDAQHVSSGEVSAGGTLDRVKVRINANQFDSGTIAVKVE